MSAENSSGENLGQKDGELYFASQGFFKMLITCRVTTLSLKRGFAELLLVSTFVDIMSHMLIVR